MDPNMDAMSQDADMMEEEPEYGQWLHRNG